MITTPPGYLQAASRSHAPRWRCSILDSAGTPIVANLPVTQGEIVKDAARDPRCTAFVDVPTERTPVPLDQSYLPTGGRLLLQYRIAEYEAWVTVADLDGLREALAAP